MASGYTLSEGAVRKLAGLVRGGMESTRRGASSPSAVSFDGYGEPWTVRWSQQQLNGAGSWVIWLPLTARMVWFEGAYVPITGLTAATGLRTGWFIVANVHAFVYLNITKNNDTGDVTAEIRDIAIPTGEGETVYNIVVAAIFEDATGVKRPRQALRSLVTIGSTGGGGGSVSVGTPKTAATSIEYTNGYDASHPYAIKLTRGYLAANANTLTIDPQDGGTGTAANLTQYIDTVPISSVVTADSLLPST